MTMWDSTSKFPLLLSDEGDTDFPRSKGEKITAKAHGGVIDIQGVTIATVDEAVRLQAVDTWFDPLEMFRQIAPGGIVNKQIMNRKVELEHALDTVEPPHNDGIKIAEQHNGESSEQHNDGIEIAEQHNGDALEHANNPAPEDVIPKHISNGTGEAADAFVPHQGADTEKAAESLPADPTDPAQEIVASAAASGADAEVSRPASNFEDASTTTTNNEESSAPTGQPDANADESRAPQIEQPDTGVDESRATGTYNAIDEYLEKPAEEVHPHPRDMEEAVDPAPGKAVAAPADSLETKMTHEEMSQLGSAGECPFLMNRE
jgi:hypothetical protein